MNPEERVGDLGLEEMGHLQTASPVSSQPLPALSHHCHGDWVPLQTQQGSSGSRTSQEREGVLDNRSHGHQPISSLILKASFSCQVPKQYFNSLIEMIWAIFFFIRIKIKHLQ